MATLSFTDGKSELFLWDTLLESEFETKTNFVLTSIRIS